MFDTSLWKTKPVEVLDQLYSLSRDPACLKKELAKHFAVSPQELKQLPLINVTAIEKIPAGHLIRVIGMVQDMFNPEVYVEQFDVVYGDQDGVDSVKKMRLGRYRDVHSLNSDEKVDETSVKFSERQAFYLVPTPGQTDWVQKALSCECQFVGVASSGSKRSFEDLSRNVTSDCPVIACEDGCDMEIENSDGVVNKKLKDGPDTITENVQCTDNSQTSVENSNFDYHLPDKRQNGQPYLIQIYEKFDELKLNDLIEVIGIYQPAHSSPNNHQQCEEGGENEFSNPLLNLSGNVGQVHALLVHRMPHSNPFLPRNIFDSSLVDSHIGASIGEMRDYLFATLLDGLLGDSLAAEYLLLHLISSVGNHSLGCKSHLTLNLTRCKPELKLPRFLSSLLSGMLCQCLTLDLSLESLAAGKDGREFYPVRDNHTGRLQPGLLQVPNRTQIIVDETLMSEGQLESRACLNLNALISVGAEQELPYDFQLYTKKYDTDVKLLILSQTKSIIQGCVEVPWSPCDLGAGSASPSVTSQLSDSSLESIYSEILNRLSCDVSCSQDMSSPLIQMRQYISLLPLRKKSYEIDTELQERINEDFVKLRKENAQWMTVEQFKFMLDILQLETLSNGETRSTFTSWEKVVKMERERKKRKENRN